MFKLYLCLFLFLKVNGFSGKVQTINDEYEHKADCIYHFAQYIKWDACDLSKEFYIGVLGPSRIIVPLEKIAQTKTANGKKIVLKKFSFIDEITFCHILFISGKALSPLEEILANSVVKGTLLVSESPGFAQKGTAINFINVNNSVKFEANQKVINSAGLKASSQLLKLAMLVQP